MVDQGLREAGCPCCGEPGCAGLTEYTVAKLEEYNRKLLETGAPAGDAAAMVAELRAAAPLLKDVLVLLGACFDQVR